MKKILDMLLGKNESLRHTRNYMMGQIVNKGLGFLLIPITTALMSTVDYGTNSIFTSTVNIFVIILPLCIYKGVTRFHYDPQYDRKEILGSEFLMMIIYMLGLGITFALTVNLWKDLAGLTVYLSMLMLVHSFMQSIINFYLAYLQAHKRSSLYAVLSVAYGAGSTLLGVFWMSQMATERYFGLIYSMLICRTIFALIGTIDMWKDMRFTNNKKIRQEIYRFCLPLIPHMISSFLLNYVDRYMIDELVGTGESGLYSFAYNFGLIVNIVVQAINQTYNPEFYEMMNAKDYKRITNRINMYQKGLLSISACVVIFAAEAIMIWANPRYHAGISLVPMICYGYILFHLYATISAYSTYYKRNGYIAIVSIITSIINIILNYIFIKQYGYGAAAYTTAFSYLIQYIICRLGNKYILKCQVHEMNSSLIRCLGFILLTYVGLGVISLLNINILLTIVVKFILLVVTFGFIWQGELKHVYSK